MSLQRGSYGVEFDEHGGFPYQKLAWVVVLVPVFALLLVFFRGCGRSQAPQPAPDDVLLAQTDTAAAVSRAPVRERPSFFQHLMRSLRGTNKTDAAKSAHTEPAPQARWMAPLPPSLLESVKKPSVPVQNLLETIAACDAKDDLLGVRAALRKLMVREDAETLRAFAERRLGEINIALLFADRPMPEKTKIRIVSGDRISTLARRYGNTESFLLKGNGIERPELLRIGHTIWVLDHPVFELTILKKSGSAILTLNGRFFKRYPIGAGRPKDTPGGTYIISGRSERPTYRSEEAGALPYGHPQNILGTRWLSLTATDNTPAVQDFGLHGTWNESTLGRPAEAGRIRFANADIEELFLLLPNGSRVNIAE